MIQGPIQTGLSVPRLLPGTSIAALSRPSLPLAPRSTLATPIDPRREGARERCSTIVVGQPTTQRPVRAREAPRVHWAKRPATILGTAGGQGPLEAAIGDASATS